MKKIILLMLAMCLTAIGLAQTNLYSETFNGPGQTGKGAIGNGDPANPTIDVTGVQWSLDISNCTLSNTDDYFQVQGPTSSGSLRSRDLDGTGIWYSQPVNIEGYVDVSFSIFVGVQGTGSTLVTEYSYDNVNWTQATSNGSLSTGFGSAGASGLVGVTLYLRILSTHSLDTSTHFIDNVSVDGTLITGAANDACIDALSIACDQRYGGDTSFATDSDASGSADVFYTFTNPGEGQEITLSLCGSNFDTVLSVYDACGGTLITENNDATCGGAFSQTSTVVFITDDVATTPTYTIKIDGNGSNEEGNYILDVSCAPCGTAVVDTATIETDCTNGQFSIVVDFASVGSATDISDGTTTYAITGSIATAGPFASGTSVDLEILHNGGLSDCNFSLNGFTYTCEIPSNDDCAGALPLTVNDDFNCGSVTAGTIKDATDSGVPSGVCSGTEDDDVWFSFVATANEHTIDIFNLSNSTNLDHSLWSGSCAGPLTSELCATDNSSTVSGLTIGDTYLLQVFSATATPNQTTTFDVCIGTTPGAPANDNFDDATTVLCGGVYTGDTTFATEDVGGFFMNGGALATIDSPNVWFVMEGTGDVISLSTCNNTSFDNEILVYRAADDPFYNSPFAEGDNECLGNNAAKTSFLSVEGEIYYISIDGGGPGVTGTFELAVACDNAPNNDNFSNPRFVFCDNSYRGVTTFASADQTSAPQGDVAKIDSNNLWYSFTGTGNVINLSTCVNTDFDTEILVYTGTSNNLTLIDEGVDECTSSLAANTSFASVEGTEYYISVDGFEGASGAFELSVSCDTPPANDNLANATPISCGNMYTGDITFASRDEIGAPNGAQALLDGPNVWFKFIGTGENAITISTCVDTFFDSELLVYTGTTGNLTLVAEGFDECTSSSAAAVTFDSVDGTVYYIAIDGFVGELGAYELDVLCTPTETVTYTFDAVNGWVSSDGTIIGNTSPNGITTERDDIIIESGDVIIDSNTTCRNVTIQPGASLTVDSGSTVLKAVGNLPSTTGGFRLNSTSTQYSSLLTFGKSDGRARYERHVNGHSSVGGIGTNNVNQGANDLIASPVASTQNFGSFASFNEDNLFENPNNPNQKLFGPFDKSTGQYLTYNINTNSALPIRSGVGYRAATSDNGGLLFTGTVRNDNVSVGISFGGPFFQEWNLIGNPYPAYLDAEVFLLHEVAPGVTNADLLTASGAAIYGYDGDTSDGWTIINLANASAANSIAPGQGFLVQARPAGVSATSGAIEFSPDMMVTGNSDDFIIGRLDQGNNAHLKLQATIGGDNRSTAIYFNDNSSSGLDVGYDASLFGNAGAKQLYTNLVSTTDESLATKAMGIQSLAYSSLGTDIAVPLGVNVSQGQQVSVSIAESSLPSNIQVYLEDLETGSYTLLNNSDYVFTANTTLTTTGRFNLRFVDEALSTTDLDLDGLQIFTTNAKDLVVKGQLFGKTNLQLFDIQGRVVLQTALNEQDTTQYINVSNLQAGVYIVKLDSNQHSKTQKVIIR